MAVYHCWLCLRLTENMPNLIQCYEANIWPANLVSGLTHMVKSCVQCGPMCLSRLMCRAQPQGHSVVAGVVSHQSTFNRSQMISKLLGVQLHSYWLYMTTQQWKILYNENYREKNEMLKSSVSSSKRAPVIKGSVVMKAHRSRGVLHVFMFFSSTGGV